MNQRSRYLRGYGFPHEGFVQQALEQYFASLGFAAYVEGDADFACTHSDTGERWLIEAKGVTSSIGVDFNTGLGQILKRMTNESTNYGIAVPDTPQFVYQCRLIHSWVRKALHLHWLLIAADGSVRQINPETQL